MYSDFLQLELNFVVSTDCLNFNRVTETIGSPPFLQRLTGVATSIIFDHREHLSEVNLQVADRYINILPQLREKFDNLANLYNEIRQFIIENPELYEKLERDYLYD